MCVLACACECIGGCVYATKKERKEMKVKERTREREKKEREWVSKRKRNAYTRKE